MRASVILREFERAQTELLGKAVVLTDGKAGTIDNVLLDELHGLRVHIRGHDGNWPISTLRMIEPDRHARERVTDHTFEQLP
jgi:hypothetical protein